MAIPPFQPGDFVFDNATGTWYDENHNSCASPLPTPATAPPGYCLYKWSVGPSRAGAVIGSWSKIAENCAPGHSCVPPASSTIAMADGTLLLKKC